MGTPHKHAEVIKAWADGAEIESKCRGDVSWMPMIAAHPTFSHHIEYRIKPEKKKAWVKMLGVGKSDTPYSICVRTESEKKDMDHNFRDWNILKDWFEVEYEDV